MFTDAEIAESAPQVIQTDLSQCLHERTCKYGFCSRTGRAKRRCLLCGKQWTLEQIYPKANRVTIGRDLIRNPNDTLAAIAKRTGTSIVTVFKVKRLLQRVDIRSRVARYSKVMATQRDS